MLGKAPTPRARRGGRSIGAGASRFRWAAAFVAFGVVLAMPLATAFGMGVDADSIVEMKNAGAKPAYGQTWAGRWMKSSGWGGFEDDLRIMRDNGVTPVIQWYYWGDDISPSCVQNGCTGRSKGEWDAMAKELGKRANAVMGGKTFYVVIEPEFNKNGIKDWETFDGYLANQADLIKGQAPGAKFVAGFGHWGGWDIFDRYVSKTELVGFQVLRGSTRDSASESAATADYMISKAKELKSRWGKSIMVFDLSIATYGGWEGVQEKALQGVLAKRSQLDDAGIKVIVWRYVYDNDHSSGYFGAAESSWGVKYKGGGKKPAYDELVALLKGASGGTTTGGGSSEPAPSSPAPSGDVFSGVKGNEWWIEAKVANSPSKVETRVNGGSWITMEKKSWGAYAVSTKAPTGSTVELRATYSGGVTKTAAYKWPSATPTTSSGGSSEPAPSGGSFDASFRPVKIEEWWVQVDVDSSQTVSKVHARVNGGSWIALEKKSWGDWAGSFKVPSGAKVEFRATSSSGATDTSGAYYR